MSRETASMSIVPRTPTQAELDSEDDEMREQREFEVEMEALGFEDEPPVRHNVCPDVDPDDSNDEEEYERARRREERDAERDANRGRRDDGNMYKGQVFFNRGAFKQAVLNHALKTGRNIKQTRFDKTNLAFDCVGRNCNWRVYCSTKPGSDRWKIRILQSQHVCEPNGECSMLKSPVIARLFIDKIRQEPEYYMPRKIEEQIMENWGFKVSRPQCQAARNKAVRMIEKEYNEQFSRLRDFGAEILESNPNSIVAIETLTNADGQDEFNRFYVCFDVLKKSWKAYCRPLIGVDGCFMKSKMNGQVLVALGRDANNAIYPIAWGVCQVENTANWLWFVRILKLDLELGEGEGYVMISDRQKGLIRAVEIALPNIEHRNCVRHVYNNIKGKVGKKPEMKLLIWSLAWSYNESDFRAVLSQIQAYDQRVYEEVVKNKPETWCRAFYRLGSFCEDVENNSTESFNASIVKARQKPMVPMLEIIARLAMTRICQREIKAKDYEGICTPYVKQYLEKEYDAAVSCRVYRSTNQMFQVVLHGCAYSVSLERRSCTCRKWDVSGIPCEHGYAVLLDRKLEVEHYVECCFRTTVWRQTYQEGLSPLRGARFWPRAAGPDIYQAPSRPQPGRPKKQKRKKGRVESPERRCRSGRVMHCRICGVAGHNSRYHSGKNSRELAIVHSHQVEPSEAGIITHSQPESSFT